MARASRVTGKAVQAQETGTRDTPARPVAVLLVEPREQHAARIRRLLMAAGLGFNVEHERTAASALLRLQERRFDVVLFAVTLADDGGASDAKRLREVAPDAALIALGEGEAPGPDGTTVLTGAQDYLTRAELTAPVLVRSMRSALERQQLLSELHHRIQEAEANATAFRTIFRATADALVIVDADRRVRLVNPAAEQLFGRSADELVGQVFDFPIVAGETRQIDIVRGAGETVVAELRGTHSEWNGRRAYLAAIRDITERRQVEEHERQLIREQVARAEAEAGERRANFLGEASRILGSSFDLASTLQNLAELTVPILADCCVIDTVDPDGRLRRMGVACGLDDDGDLLPILQDALPDASVEAMVGQALRSRTTEVLDSLDEEALKSVAGAASTALAAHGITRALVVPLTNRIAVGCMTFLSRRTRGGYSSHELTMTGDLARRALIAIENSRLYEQAQKANKAKADFLAVMSHELRTPLNAIIGYSDLLLMGVPVAVPEEARAQIEKVRTSGRHLLSLIEEILSYARLEAGREKVRADRIGLQELIRDVSDITTPLAQQKGIRFELVAPEDDVELHTDAGKVRQILLNLLSNAVKFTNQGAVRLIVERHSESVEFHVRDSGIGINLEHIERIFEPFWQAESSRTRRAEGTGLGLSVARRFARLLGGEITVWSEAGAGTTFSVRLPIRLSGALRNAGYIESHEPVGESAEELAKKLDERRDET